ncbi:MAG: HD domain-containing protein [Oscillospiraceae bacterium]|nr:HD domain-containing protein [Oscillospiraceae bacterium]
MEKNAPVPASISLVPASIGLLFDGMVAPHDIYGADAKLLLIRRGNTLTQSRIEALRRISTDQDTIMVSAETQRLMLEHSLACKIESQAALEEETGYTEIKDETLTLLQDIQHTGAVPKGTIREISDGLSSRLEGTKPDVILDLVNSLAPVDEYLQRHCINVSLLNGLIGKWLDLPKEEIEWLVLVGLLHDCGKTSFPTQILSAPRPLAVAEFEVLKMHTVHSYDLLTDFPENVRHGTLAHHEKYCGQGYPNGLSGESISLMAQVTAVSDIYDAMVSRRAYKAPQNPFSTLTQLSNMKATELSPLIVDTFIQNMPKELINKPVKLSNGSVGLIHAFDLDDPEYPHIRVGGQVIKSTKELFCVSMYHEEDIAST